MSKCVKVLSITESFCQSSSLVFWRTSTFQTNTIPSVLLIYYEHCFFLLDNPVVFIVPFGDINFLLKDFFCNNFSPRAFFLLLLLLWLTWLLPPLGKMPVTHSAFPSDTGCLCHRAGGCMQCCLECGQSQQTFFSCVWFLFELFLCAAFFFKV